MVKKRERVTDQLKIDAFANGTGSITIKIDHDKWFGAKVTPHTKVTIQGEIDKEFNHSAIDVDHIRAID